MRRIQLSALKKKMNKTFKFVCVIFRHVNFASPLDRYAFCAVASATIRIESREMSDVSYHVAGSSLHFPDPRSNGSNSDRQVPVALRDHRLHDVHQHFVLHFLAQRDVL